MLRKTLFLLAFAFIIASCKDENVISNEEVNFDNAVWTIDNETEFKLTVDDPEEHYQILCTIKNTSDYPYSNLYIKWYLIDNEDNIIIEELTELQLFDEKTGKPLGVHAGEEYNRSKNLTENYKFEKAGSYKVKLKQYMRKGALPGIVGAGIALKKTHKK